MDDSVIEDLDSSVRLPGGVNLPTRRGSSASVATDGSVVRVGDKRRGSVQSLPPDVGYAGWEKGSVTGDNPKERRFSLIRSDLEVDSAEADALLAKAALNGSASATAGAGAGAGAGFSSGSIGRMQSGTGSGASLASAGSGRGGPSSYAPSSSGSRGGGADEWTAIAGASPRPEPLSGGAASGGASGGSADGGGSGAGGRGSRNGRRGRGGSNGDSGGGGSGSSGAGGGGGGSGGSKKKPKITVTKRSFHMSGRPIFEHKEQIPISSTNPTVEEVKLLSRAPRFLILRALSGPVRGTYFYVTADMTTIGGAAGDATIKLPDRTASAAHAAIEHQVRVTCVLMCLCPDPYQMGSQL